MTTQESSSLTTTAESFLSPEIPHPPTRPHAIIREPSVRQASVEPVWEESPKPRPGLPCPALPGRGGALCMDGSPGNLRDLCRLHDKTVGVGILLLLVVRVPEAGGPGSGPAGAAGPWGLRGCRGAGACVFGGAVLLLGCGRAV